jgi:ATP synthase protein I
MFFGLSLQAGVILAMALLAWGWQGWTVTVAVMCGGGVALLNSTLLVWRWHRGLRDYHCDGERHLGSFYRSSLERFFVVGISLAVGLAFLNLAPLPLLTGFIVGQLAWVIAAAVHKTG